MADSESAAFGLKKLMGTKWDQESNLIINKHITKMNGIQYLVQREKMAGL